MKILFELFLSFFKIGIMTFGGGMAMLPMLEKEIVENKKWTTPEEILDYYAVGQCTPGIIAVNIATFIGHKKKGVIGGIIATLGVITPSVIIILIIAAFLNNITSSPIVQSVFNGIRVAVCALIISSIIGLIKKGVKDYIGVVIAIIAFILVAFFSLSPVWVVLAAIVTGISIKSIKEGKK